MNDNSTTNRDQSRMPSDDQMDSLLRGFFRLEVPAELNQPLRRNPFATATAATLTLAQEHHVEQLRPRSVRIVGVAASVAAMALAVLVLVSDNHKPLANGSGFAGRDTTTPDNNTPMLVSPQGNSRTATKVVGPDGVTLEETDSILLHPQK